MVKLEELHEQAKEWKEDGKQPCTRTALNAHRMAGLGSVKTSGSEAILPEPWYLKCRQPGWFGLASIWSRVRTRMIKIEFNVRWRGCRQHGNIKLIGH